MIPIRFIYTENGKEKSSLDEHKRRVEIMEHNQRLNKLYPINKKSTRWDLDMKELLEAIDLGLNNRYIVVDGDDHTLCVKDRESERCFDIIIKEADE